MRRLRSAPKILLPAILISLAAFWGVIELTEPPGPGLDPDALSYLGAGNALAHGHGLRVPSSTWNAVDTTGPLVHFPPGFPSMIALGVAAGATAVNAARFVEATAAAIAAFSLVLAASAAGGLVAALVALGIVATTPAFVIVHGGVLSEPLFLALLALFTWQLSRERLGDGTRRTIALGALAAAATLVRYAGASLVAAAVLDAWWSVEGSWRLHWTQRARRAFVAAEVPVIVLGAWVLTRSRGADSERIRDVGLYTAGLGNTLLGGMHTIERWLAPGVDPESARAAAAIAVSLALGALAVRTARAARRGLLKANELRVFRATTMVVACYLLVVGASRLLADPGIPLDERILAPVFLIAALMLGVALAAFWRASFLERRGVVIFTVGLTASWMWGSLDVSTGYVNDFRTDGGDLAGRDWAASPLVQWAARARPGTPLYSNWPAAVWFHTGRATHELPSELDSSTVLEFRSKLEREHGAVLSFRVRAEDYAPPDSLAALAGLLAVERWPGGTIWRVPADSVRLLP